MARKRNRVSPEVAVRLADLARQMREVLYDDGGIPVWGTKFSEIENDCLAVGQELSRLMMEQAVDGQADQVPDGSLNVEGEAARPVTAEPTRLETPAGEILWEQPKARLKRSRRDFFPSGESSGD